MTIENEPFLFSNSIVDWEIPSILYMKDGGREVRLFQMHAALSCVSPCGCLSLREGISQPILLLPGLYEKDGSSGGGHIAFSFLLWEVIFLQLDATAALPPLRPRGNSGYPSI